MKNIALILLFLAFSCSNELENSQTENEKKAEEPIETLLFSAEKFKNAEIVLGGVEKRELDSYINANGMIDVPPSNRASIGTPVGGFVRKAEQIIGDQVQKGQVLVVLEHPEYVRLQQNYWEAQKRLELAQKTLQRENELRKEQASAEKNWEKAESEYQTAKIQVATFAEQLRILGIDPEKIQSDRPQSTVSLLAPFDGFVTQMNVNLGKYVNPNEVLYELISKEHLHLELNIFEKDISKVQKGQKVQFQFLSEPENWYRGEVFQIAQHFDPETKSLNVHVHLQEPDKERFKIGMYVAAKIAVQHLVRETLPKEAVFGTEEKYCWVGKKEGENYRFRKIKLVLGEENKQFQAVQLPENLANGEQIVLKGAYYLEAEANKSGETEHHH